VARPGIQPDQEGLTTGGAPRLPGLPGPPATARPRRARRLARLLRLELRTELRRKRTVVTLAVLAIIPVVLGCGVSARGTAGRGPSSGLIAATAGNGLMLPVTGLGLTLGLLLPLGVSVAAADALAGEVMHGTLRGLLLAPVRRPTLVAVKAAAVLTMAVLQVAVVSLFGLLTGVALVGGGGQLLTLSGSTVSLGAALSRVALAAGWTALQVGAVGAVALAVSALTDHPLVVTGTVLGGAIVFDLLSDVPALDWLHPALLTTGWTALPDVLRDPLPLDQLGSSALVATGYLVAGLTAALLGMLCREA
jgi:ABC-2 type transport system permease protein